MSHAEWMLNEWKPNLHVVEADSPRANEPGELRVLSPEDFYRHHAPRLMNVARRILKDNELARDAVQESFHNIFLHVSDFRGDSSLETWMTRIVVNVCLGYLRKHKIRLKGEVECDETGPSQLVQDQGANPLEVTYRGELRAMVQKALTCLKKMHREVIYLHDIRQQTLEEISESLGIPVGTIKSRLFYGRRELRAVIEAIYSCQACPVR